MAPAADYLILKRRAQEEARLQYEQITKNNFKASANAVWEIKTSGFIEHQQMQQRYNSIRAADEEALNARRRRLADMLGHEQAMFQQQLEALTETPEQRKVRMQNRAKELGDKREAERVAYVRQQYERQWRLACDPLREQESKEILKATNAARSYQIGEKMKQLEMGEMENRAFDAMWEQDRLAKLGREEAEEAARKKMDFEHKLVLDQQVSELQAFRDSERQLAADEATLMQSAWDLEREESKKVERLRHDVVMKAHTELHNFNKHKKQQLQDEVAAERKADMDRLNAALAAEKAEADREQAAKDAMAGETRRFAEAMLAQKRALASKEGEMEAARQKEMNKAWDKRLAVWGKEQEARELLMAQVLDERKNQVLVKLENAKIDKEKQALARHRLEEELRRVNAVEAAKNEEHKQTRAIHGQLLENQIKDKAFKRAAAEFNKAQERMTAERAEAAYQMMLQDQLAKTTSSMNKFSNLG